MTDKIDTKFIGWLRTIYYIFIPLKPIYIGKWFITFSIPHFISFYRSLKYIIKRTKRCFKCNKTVPAWQYGSYEGSDGVCCAECSSVKGKII